MEFKYVDENLETMEDPLGKHLDMTMDISFGLGAVDGIRGLNLERLSCW